MSRTARRVPPKRRRTPRQTRYQALLRDPRWQRRRLEIFQRDSWRCRQCGATDQELHVHHRWYLHGGKPWDVPGQALVTLCVGCHAKQRRH